MSTRIAQPLRRRARLAPLVIGLAVVAAGLAVWLVAFRDDGRPAPAQARPALHATPATLGTVFAKAAGGETILLAPGDYGAFAAGAKPKAVTIRAPRGTVARMSLAFAAAANVRVEGLTLDGGEIGGSSHDVAVAHSTFHKAILIRADRMADAHVVLDGNRLAGIDVCPDCYEGRLQIIGDSGRPSGIVIRNNVLGPGGNADGIQNGGNGVQILDNTFVGIHDAEGGPHTDALQLYGQRNTVVRGNSFRDVGSGVMSPDGGRHEIIEDNVFDTGSYPYAIMLGGDDGSVIRHNTMPQLGRCAWGIPCGTLLIGDGPGGRASRATVVEDNILGQLSLAGATKLRAQRNNLIAVGRGATADRVGRPLFAGGARPTSRAGFRLAGGSPGAKAASDGADVGIAAPRGG